MSEQSDAVDRGATVTFERSAGRVVFEGAGVGCGAVLFLGMAALFLGGIIAQDLVMRLFGAAGFGFFGLMMAAGALSAARRGTDTRAAEVGPSGVWLPEMGRLPWSAIAEVRLERMRGVGGGDAPVTQQYRRLGFAPRDPTLKPRVTTALGWQMVRAYFALVKLIAPQIRLGGDDAAPFGVSEMEIPGDFDRLIETVGRYLPVRDAAEARARHIAGRWPGIEAPPAAPPVDVSRLDAALGERPVTGAGAPLVDPATLATPQPRAAFGVRRITTMEVVFSVLPVVAPLVVILPFVLPMMLTGESGAIFGLIFLGFFLVFFVAPGVVQLVRLVRRARERRADTARLRVGPEGIWTRSSGLLGWEAIREIRTERAGWVRQIGTPGFERWRLAIDAGDGSSHGVASDELDADFDDILSLVRFYHPVVETS